MSDYEWLWKSSFFLQIFFVYLTLVKSNYVIFICLFITLPFWVPYITKQAEDNVFVDLAMLNQLLVFEIA